MDSTPSLAVLGAVDKPGWDMNPSSTSNHYVTLGWCPPLSEPQFPHLSIGLIPISQRWPVVDAHW